MTALIAGFLFGRYTSDTGRYFFKFDGKYPALFDTNTGDIYFRDDDRKLIKINYKEEINNPTDKKK